jgi:hypothetical protein
MSAAVTGSGRYRKPLPKAAITGGRYRKRAGGGDGSGRYINNPLRQDASTGPTRQDPMKQGDLAGEINR